MSGPIGGIVRPPGYPEDVRMILSAYAVVGDAEFFHAVTRWELSLLPAFPTVLSMGAFAAGFRAAKGIYLSRVVHDT